MRETDGSGRDESNWSRPESACRLAGIRVRIKARIIRTADVNRDAMTLVEDQARRPEVDLELIDLSHLHEDRLTPSRIGAICSIGCAA